MKLIVTTLCAIHFFQCFANAANILAVIPFPARSHYAPFEPLFKRLAQRGHRVTVLSEFPQKEQIPNFIDISVSTNLPTILRGSMPLPVADNMTAWNNAHFMMGFIGARVCEGIFRHPRVRELLDSDQKFDLIISEIFTTDCILSFVHKFKAPYVGITSSVAMPWLPSILGHPDNPSYIPHFYSRYSDHMNYFERFLNALYLVAFKINYRIYSDKVSHGIAKEYFGPELPDFDTLRSKVCLALVNSHHTVSAPRPLAPGVKEVGGIHIPSTGPPELPEDLQEYLDSAKEGVVYFAIGSQLNSTTFPAKNMAIYLKAFAEIPQRVLWKCNEHEIPNLPKNVKCIGWSPQLAILCHPNVRVFFSHGGLLGTQEAVFCGVPILGMPLFGDQFLNIAHAVDRGFALKIEYHNPSYDEFTTNLNRLLTEPSFSERAKEVSRRFRDRPQAPLDEAVFWVEYILRHGPEALRTAASELAWYQYLLLDVVGGIFIVVLVAFWILKKLWDAILCRQKNGTKNPEKKTN